MEALQYAAGFFDGDGCVTINHGARCSQMGRVVVEFTQSCHGWVALERLKATLESQSGINCKMYNMKSVGNRQPRKMLRVLGLAVPLLLSHHSYLKRAQLETAAQYEQSFGLDAKLELEALKRQPHAAITKELAIPYVAGFFDADGCVMIRKRAYTICAEASQKYPAICEALQRQFGGSIYKGKGREQYTWHLGSLKAVEFLRKVLPYLVHKKRQAEIVIEFVERKMSAEDAMAGLRALKGICSRTVYEGVYGKRKADEIES